MIAGGKAPRCCSARSRTRTGQPCSAAMPRGSIWPTEVGVRAATLRLVVDQNLVGPHASRPRVTAAERWVSRLSSGPAGPTKVDVVHGEERQALLKANMRCYNIETASV